MSSESTALALHCLNICGAENTKKHRTANSLFQQICSEKPSALVKTARDVAGEIFFSNIRFIFVLTS